MLTVSHSFAAFSPGDSPLHRLDPRTKMLMALCLGVVAVAARSYPGLVVLLGGGIAAILLARPGADCVFGLLKIVLVLAGAALLLNGLFTPGIRLPGPSSAPIWPTEAGVSAGFTAALRLVAMACIVFSLVVTTSSRQISEGVDLTLGKLSFFRGAGLAVNVACRFLPDFVQEAQRMRLIRSVRAPHRKLDLRSKLREAGSMMLALVVIAVRRAERVADAMTARCYESGAARTTWRPRRFTMADGVALGITSIACLLAIRLGTT
jgi:energy-coupling factor transport system permease protein